MNLKERIHKEKTVLPLMLKGYSRSVAVAWYRETNEDLKNYADTYGEETIRGLHKRKYLCRSIERYGLLDGGEDKYITDFDYIRLSPFNNDFYKWTEDLLTTSRVLKDHREHFRSLYFTVIRRYMAPRVMRVDQEDREYYVGDVLRLLKEKGELELRPVYWTSTRPRYLLGWQNGAYWVNGKKSDEKAVRKIFDTLYSNYIVADPVKIRYSFSEKLSREHSIKLWLTNDGEEPAILSATVTIYWNEGGKRRQLVKLLDFRAGTFVLNGETVTIPGWEQVTGELLQISRELEQLSYYTVTIALQNGAPFQFLHFSHSPRLPEVTYHDELNDYLLNRLEWRRKQKVSLGGQLKTMRRLLFEKWVKKYCRPGIRPYMQELWMRAWWSDLLHTKLPLSKKIWAWKRGFISYHVYQYGLTEENYKNYVADYDYYWLNRINNDYQKWINDKTTYRLIMEPFKQYVPRYYYSVYNRYGEMHLARMWDCPEGYTAEYESMLKLLRKKGKLAMKPSAGTHGDGFYCLAYENGRYLVNGKEHTKKQLLEKMQSFKSFYVITEYLEMHQKMKDIYAGAVSTVRMMVINTKGYNPKIMQTYARIGASSTGFTDNVGYGGICVMVDTETGELYDPQTIKEHIYYPCPNHPDTGTPIAGPLPNWDLICREVLNIAKYLCQLEYLGFDVAITPDGFCVLEINVHQDLHKVNLFSDEIKEFFDRKIMYKKG